jgi:hypothetical protein
MLSRAAKVFRLTLGLLLSSGNPERFAAPERDHFELRTEREKVGDEPVGGRVKVAKNKCGATVRLLRPC